MNKLKSNLRVEELEDSKYNPVKYFHPGFDLALCRHVHNSPLVTEDNDLGEKAVKLVNLVTKIDGVSGVTVSKLELRVSKKPPYSWDELSESVRAAFREVYGQNIVFQLENPIILAARRLKVKINL